MEKNVLVDNQKGRNLVDRKYCVSTGITPGDMMQTIILDQKNKNLIIAWYNSVAYIFLLLEQ